MHHPSHRSFRFKGINSVGFRAVKVFAIKYYPKLAKVWRFFVKPEGHDLYCPLKTRKHLCRLKRNDDALRRMSEIFEEWL